jgi:hypothetical protein
MAESSHPDTMIGVSTRAIKKGEIIRHECGMLSHWGTNDGPSDLQLQDDVDCWEMSEDIPGPGMFLCSPDGLHAEAFRIKAI